MRFVSIARAGSAALVLGGAAVVRHFRGAREKAWRSADDAEARQLLDAEISKLRRRTYGDLLGLMDDTEDYWVTGPSGTRWGVEVNAFWDDVQRGNGDLRIIATIDDGRETASWPMSDSFILNSDGNFVGE